MSDKLKNRFQHYQLPQADLPEGHEARFLNKIESKTNQTQPKMYTGVAAAVAFIAVVISLAGFLQTSVYSNSATVQTAQLGQVSPQLEEMELHFQRQLNDKRIEAVQIAQQNPDLAGFLDELNQLEEAYKALEKALAENANNDRVIKAMIDNYRMRLEILEQMFIYSQMKKNPVEYNS